MRPDLTLAGSEISQPLRKVEFIHGLNADRAQFIENIKTNCASKVVPRLISKRALVVGGGPSAADHVEEIRQLRSEGWELFAVNGAHDWLIGLGITPTGCVAIESNAVADSFIKKPVHTCTYYLASQVNPKLFRRLVVDGGFRVRLFHVELDEEATKLIEEIDPNPTILVGAQTAGLHTLGVCYFEGMKKLRVYGMDSSHRPDRDHAYDNSQQHHADTVEFVFKDETFKSTGTWAAQAVRFAKMWPHYFRRGMRIEVVGDGLLPAMYRHVKEELMTELQQRAAEQDQLTER